MASSSKHSAVGSTSGDFTVSSSSSSCKEGRGLSPSLVNQEENSNRGMKRKARDEPASTLEAEHPCMILELPQDVKSIIVSFQAHKDRLSVAATCGDFWKAVEAFSERKLDEFRLAHATRIDDTWEARINDQTAIDTEMPKPLELPYRYLLWRAFRTYLYSFGSLVPGIDTLHVLPDGTRVVTIGEDDVIRLWNLSTKESTVIFDGSDQEVESVMFCGENVVTEFGGSCHVFALDGTVVCSAPVNGQIHAMAVGQQKVFFAFYEHDNILCLDFASGSFRENMVPWDIVSVVYITGTFKMDVCGDMLVALRRFNNDHEPNDFPNGLYVFDLGAHAQKHFFPGVYHNFVKATDDENTIVASRIGGIVDVLNLENGRLYRSFSFTCSSGRVFSKILLVNQSRAYMEVRYGQNQRHAIEVYNLLNGELIRTFDDSRQIYGASTNGRELFFGGSGAGDNNIRAYSLQTS